MFGCLQPNILHAFCNGVTNVGVTNVAVAGEQGYVIHQYCHCLLIIRSSQCKRVSSCKSANSLLTTGWQTIGGTQDPTREGVEVLKQNNGHNHLEEVTSVPSIYRHYKPRLPSVSFLKK